jgi:hypothetical protein
MLQSSSPFMFSRSIIRQLALRCSSGLSFDPNVSSTNDVEMKSPTPESNEDPQSDDDDGWSDDEPNDAEDDVVDEVAFDDDVYRSFPVRRSSIRWYLF